MAKFLLIGSRGTLGSEFSQLIPQQLPNSELILADRPELDITDLAAVKDFISRCQPTVVINCSAYTNVDGAETDFEAALLLNADAVQNLATVCKTNGATLVHFSTGMVFPGTSQTGSDETATPQPVNKYGASKLAGETAIQTTGGQYYIIRTEWLYGKPRTETAKKSFVELMIDLGKSGKVKGVIDEIGRPTWAKDLAQAVLEILNSNPTPASGIYHLANEGQASRLDWAKEIYRILNMDVLTEAVHGSDFPRPAARPHHELINNTKLPKMRSWQDALAEYLAPEN